MVSYASVCVNCTCSTHVFILSETELRASYCPGSFYSVHCVQSLLSLAPFRPCLFFRGPAVNAINMACAQDKKRRQILYYVELEAAQECSPLPRLFQHTESTEILRLPTIGDTPERTKDPPPAWFELSWYIVPIR